MRTELDIIAEKEYVRQEEKTVIAKNLMSMGMKTEDVAKATGLSIELVNALE